MLLVDSNYLTASFTAQSQFPLKRAIISCDVAVQTETLSMTPSSPRDVHDVRVDSHDDQESTLSATDLASILKWSKDISRDINLSSGSNMCHLFHLEDTQLLKQRYKG